jgi:hypothetical protein
MARAAHDPVQAAARPPGPGRAGRERPTPGRADPGRAAARSGAGAPSALLVRGDDDPPDLPESLAQGGHPSRAPPVAGARRAQGGGPLENLA